MYILRLPQEYALQKHAITLFSRISLSQPARANRRCAVITVPTCSYAALYAAVLPPTSVGPSTRVLSFLISAGQAAPTELLIVQSSSTPAPA
jgi:hypothetical protein